MGRRKPYFSRNQISEIINQEDQGLDEQFASNLPQQAPEKLQKKLGPLLLLIAAGEAIFLLPFVLARVFRGTLLEVFNITNLELGTAFSAYGVLAMLSYAPGGFIADKFSPKALMAIALISTGLGGIYYATIPDLEGLTLVYTAWGLTTILLFWAAMLKATRIIGGGSAQGSAFGLLDGGRGLMGAIVGSLALVVFASFLPDGAATFDAATKKEAFVRVLWLVAILVMLVGVAVYIFLPKVDKTPARAEKFNLNGIVEVLKIPKVWLQGVIIVCGYVAYKSTDNFSLFAEDVMQMNAVDAAGVGTLALWLRPIAAVGAGFLADKFSTSKMIAISFVLILVGSLGITAGVLVPGTTVLLFSIIITSCAGIYALRGLYFAITAETKVPVAFTGTAIGIVSVLGYTPDVFWSPLQGYLLDEYPGMQGHQIVFGIVAIFAVVGIIANYFFNSSRFNRN